MRISQKTAPLLDFFNITIDTVLESGTVDKILGDLK
jgi:ABC-type amino acid transport substrate-binding protein